MTVSLSTNPGQTVRIIVATKDGYGERVDGYAAQVDFVLNPDLTEFSGTFPASMEEVSVGLYSFEIALPSGVSNIGTYIASVSWIDPDSGSTQYEDFLINSFRPFGNSSVSPG